MEDGKQKLWLMRTLLKPVMSLFTLFMYLLIFVLFLKIECNFFSFSGALKWKEDLTQKAAEAFLRQQRSTPNLRKLVYGTGTNLF